MTPEEGRWGAGGSAATSQCCTRIDGSANVRLPGGGSHGRRRQQPAIDTDDHSVLGYSTQGETLLSTIRSLVSRGSGASMPGSMSGTWRISMVQVVPLAGFVS